MHSVEIKIDKTAPSIESVKVLPIVQLLNGYVNITCDIVDINTQVVKVNIMKYPNESVINTTMISTDSATYYFNATYDEEGVYDSFIWAEDESGHSSVSLSYRFYICNLTYECKISCGKNNISSESMDVELVINSNDVTNVTVGNFSENPVGEVLSVDLLGKYLEINIENESVVGWPIYVRIYYSLEDLSRNNITEAQLLGIYYWNEENETWEMYNDTGVNVTDILVNGTQYAGYVWANIWHLTLIAPGANPTVPLEVNIQSDPSEVKRGGNLTYTIAIKNTGGASAQNVRITEYYDSNFIPMSFDPMPSEGNNIWRFDSIGPGETKKIKITGIAADNNETMLQNMVHYYSSNGGWGRVWERTTVLYAEPHIELEAPTEAEAGDGILCKLIYYNAGNMDMKNVTVRFTFPHMEFVYENTSNEKEWHMNTLGGNSGFREKYG
ncbi:MAG: hypothetical protein U9O96_07015 [Candidatus Thermoplasmatota archaeon]|nr:hypothetical protein [Candidatus Thermoplasmatota archaeon]